MKQLNFIDYNISLPDKIPSNILEQLGKLEQYNNEGDSVCYYDRWDDLIVLAKNAMVAGVLSQKDWETIEKRFWYGAEMALYIWSRIICVYLIFLHVRLVTEITEVIKWMVINM